MGGFDSCLNRKSGLHRLLFSITIDNPAHNPDSPQWQSTISQFKLGFECGRQVRNQKPSFKSCLILADGDKLLSAWKPISSKSGREFNVDFNWEHPALKFTSSLPEEEKQALETQFRYTTITCLNFLPSRLFNSPTQEEVESEEDRQKSLESFDEELRREFSDEELRKMCLEHAHASEKVWKYHPAVMDGLLPVIENLFACYGDAVREMVYVPPLREIPDRWMDLRGCSLSGWRWLAGNSEICKRVNATLKHLKIDHEMHIRTLIPSETARKSIYQILAQAETGENWGALSDAIEKARTDFETLEYAEYKDWLDSHPDFFDKMVDYWDDIIRSNPQNGYQSGYFEEYPESDESCAPDWWIKEEAERQAESFLDDWTHRAEASFKDEATRLYITENPGVREAIESALKVTDVEADLLPGDGHLQLRLHDPKRNVWMALQDVGVGTSQVLPIIIEAYAQKSKLILVEQPELHLHPALQAELGDVFIESALGENKNTFLLETHSEHLILRILRRIRETTEGDMDDWPEALRKACPNGIRPEDVAVLYVKPGEDGAQVEILRTNELGEFVDEWPGGFFDERIREIL